MKTFLSLFLSASALIALVAGSAPRAARGAAEAAVKTTTLGVSGMTCGACSTSVRVVLKKLDGVIEAKVSLEEKKAVVTYDPVKVSPDKMVETIESKLPYKARVLASAKGK